MPYPLRDQARHTYGEYLSWPEEVRYELIEGVAYAMSPAPARIHQEIVGEIFRQIANHLENRACRVYVAPFEVRLAATDEADADIVNVVQPDITVICDPRKLDQRGCRGAPDWITEVISPASAAHDQIRKLALYERHGVNEYWVIHPLDRIVSVYEKQDAGYAKPRLQELEGSQTSATLPDIVIDWERVTRRIS